MSSNSHDGGPSRRHFIRQAAAGSVALSLPWQGASAATQPALGELSRDLLQDWCDGMLAVRIDDPSDPARHGALGCPACDIIHGRCMDAVHPFLHMAAATGREDYLEAGIAVFEWSKNVSQPDGSWTVIPDPDSWRGITVFGAIALAEALHHHGDLLDAARRERWTERLARAADYVYRKFTALDVSNINYGCTTIHAMNLLGRVLERPEYLKRSRRLASELDAFVSPNGLLVGEGKPARETSPRGCRPVDLGYNVEESLPCLALCADATGDPALTALVTRLLETHLEFMLPDGGWDNSWGTRQAKWTYWGSRTSDGCQPGYALLASKHPAFATAALENTRLLRRCTDRGLLHGGPHYIARGAKPCVHHTFTHAKALATILERGGLPAAAGTPLPRARADGLKSYPEIATWLAARGPWRATVTASDWIYRPQVQQPTGGVLSMVWHEKVGPIFAGSMARYHRVEPYNMQLPPDAAHHPLTPRVECRQDDEWFTQLHDPNAEVSASDRDGVIHFDVATRLRNEARREPAGTARPCAIGYRFDRESLTLTARAPGDGSPCPRLVLPLISPADEKVRRTAGNRLEIHKPGGVVILEANAPLHIQEFDTPRIFNLVPGFEAVPVFAEVPSDSTLECRIRVTS